MSLSGLSGTIPEQRVGLGWTIIGGVKPGGFRRHGAQQNPRRLEEGGEELVLRQAVVAGLSSPSWSRGWKLGSAELVFNSAALFRVGSSKNPSSRIGLGLVCSALLPSRTAGLKTNSDALPATLAS